MHAVSLYSVYSVTMHVHMHCHYTHVHAVLLYSVYKVTIHVHIANIQCTHSQCPYTLHSATIQVLFTNDTL